MILSATPEYRVVFFYLFWITTIFQTNILFKTKKYQHRGPSWSGGPGAIAPVAPPLIRPCLHVITVFAWDHQVKKVIISVNHSMFNQCCTLTPASISNTKGCLRSGKVSHAVVRTTKVTWISNKRLRKQLEDLQLGELRKRSLSQMPIAGIEYWWNNALRMHV